MATARSGTFLAVHALDDARAAQSARGKALGLVEGRGHREFVGVHAVNDATDDAAINAKALQFPATRQKRSPARMAVGPDATSLFADSVHASKVSHSDVAAACGLARQEVTKWIAGAIVPSDCVLLIIDRLSVLGVEILRRCARRLPIDARRGLAIGILEDCA